MARGRMVNKKISNSRVVNDLPESAQLLYTWLIPHLDCNGCFYGSPQMIKSLVFPRKKYSKTKIENWLKLMENSHGTENSPLIVRYSVNGEQYLFMPGFKGEQIGLRYDKEKPEFPTFDGKFTESVGQKSVVSRREVEVEVEVKEEDKDNPPISPLSSDPSIEKNDNINNFYPTIDQVVWLYQEKILLGGTVTEEMDKKLRAACGRYSPALVHRAIKEGIRQRKPSWKYIMGILQNWSTERQ